MVVIRNRRLLHRADDVLHLGHDTGERDTDQIAPHTTGSLIKQNQSLDIHPEDETGDLLPIHDDELILRLIQHVRPVQGVPHVLR